MNEDDKDVFFDVVDVDAEAVGKVAMAGLRERSVVVSSGMVSRSPTPSLGFRLEAKGPLNMALNTGLLSAKIQVWAGIRWTSGSSPTRKTTSLLASLPLDANGLEEERHLLSFDYSWKYFFRATWMETADLAQNPFKYLRFVHYSIIRKNLLILMVKSGLNPNTNRERTFWVTRTLKCHMLWLCLMPGLWLKPDNCFFSSNTFLLLGTAT